MREILYFLVMMVAKVHNLILRLNDKFEYNFSDKQLHFLVIGIFGLLLVFAIYPVFKYLAKHGFIMTITWIYVFTLIIVITFAIEIGQKVTHTGAMEFADIMFGVVGFLAMFAIFACIRGIYHGIRKLIEIRKQEKEMLEKKIKEKEGDHAQSN